MKCATLRAPYAQESCTTRSESPLADELPIPEIFSAKWEMACGGSTTPRRK